jgi:hypothetical protein
MMITFDGLDDAIAGTSDVWMTDGTKVLRYVYNGDKMVEIFVKQGMTEDEAMDWIDFNVEGAYCGEATPVIFWRAFENEDA